MGWEFVWRDHVGANLAQRPWQHFVKGHHGMSLDQRRRHCTEITDKKLARSKQACAIFPSRIAVIKLIDMYMRLEDALWSPTWQRVPPRKQRIEAVVPNLVLSVPEIENCYSQNV
jgi:hypothetical protein